MVYKRARGRRAVSFFLYKLKYVFHSFTLVLGFKVSKVATVVRVYGKVTHEKLLFFPFSGGGGGGGGGRGVTKKKQMSFYRAVGTGVYDYTRTAASFLRPAFAFGLLVLAFLTGLMGKPPLMHSAL